MGADILPARVSLAQLPTPFHQLQRYDADVRSRLWLKRDDLTGFLLSGNKVRKLEFVLAHAQSLGVERIITCGGIQSNHCRATAFACAQLGLKCHLILRDAKGRDSGGNYMLDQLAGAQQSIYPVNEYASNLSAIADQWLQAYAARGERALFVPTGASDGVGIWGYAAAAFELLEDFERAGIAPKVVACATGSGGTQAGLALGFALAGSDIEVVGYAVCDDAAYFDSKVASDIAKWQGLNPSLALMRPPRYRTVDNYVGRGYAKPGAEDLAEALRLAKLEGILLDPVYTGKAFYGLVTDMRTGQFGANDVVFVHTGGGFGVFPYEGDYQALLGV
ncbi:MAG TPA: D-cysteine desulfhydrase family protein [Marinagarivorans sp.]